MYSYPNPFDPRAVGRFGLTPDAVDCIVFWTKNPAPMLDGLERLTDCSLSGKTAASAAYATARSVSISECTGAVRPAARIVVRDGAAAEAKRYGMHDIHPPMMLGHPRPEDTIRERPANSLRKTQGELF